MIDYYIRQAIEFREKETKRPFDSYEGDDAFSKCIYDLQNSLTTWPNEVISLLDVYNWNLQRLTNEGKLRKPKAYLLLEVTTKDNLVLDWYPDKPAQNYLHETDFRYWSSYWQPTSMPDNRILMIHGFDHLLPYNKPARHSIKYLLEAIREHIHDIIRILKQLIDVELVSDMYLEYSPLPIPKGKSPTSVERKELVTCRVLSVKEIADIEEQKWFKNTFSEMGISAEDFLEMFWEAGGKYSRFAKKLKEKGVKGVGEVTAKQIIERLKSSFSELYFLNMPKETSEATIDTAKGKIIRIGRRIDDGDIEKE